MKGAIPWSVLLLLAARPGQSSSVSLSHSWPSGALPNAVGRTAPPAHPCSKAGSHSQPTLVVHTQEGPAFLLGPHPGVSLNVNPCSHPLSPWALLERDSLCPACWGEATTDPSRCLQCLVEAEQGAGRHLQAFCLRPRGQSHGLACGLSHIPSQLAHPRERPA